MRLLSIFLFLLSLGLAFGAPAQNEFVFAVPATGRITLGVFDKNGHLVRTLHALYDEEKFQVGLNGFISHWDGLDDSGKKVSPGIYHIRGYQIGEVAVSGEAFHFNDWISESGMPPISKIEDFEVLDGGDILLTAKTPTDSVFIRASIQDGTLAVEKSPPVDQTGPARQKLTELSGQPAEAFHSIDAFGDTILGASADGVWISQNGTTPRKIDLPARVESVSLVNGESFWFVGNSSDSTQPPVVGEADFNGEILRALPY